MWRGALGGTMQITNLRVAVTQLALLLALSLHSASAQTNAAKSSSPPLVSSAKQSPLYLDNLRGCLTGAVTCRPAMLSADDLVKAQAADYLRNFASCLGGYRIACKHAMLLPEDLERVREAEYQTNLKTCLTGYSVTCRRNELRSDDLAAVQKAEYRVNLNRCITPHRLECKQELLTSEDRERITSLTKSSVQQQPVTPAPSSDPKPTAKTIQAATMSAAAIAALLVQESRNAYYRTGRPCACPDDLTSGGRRCGGNSAYSRPGGAAPYCYVSDVPTSMIQKYQMGLSGT
jgi:hypothetical protein